MDIKYNEFDENALRLAYVCNENILIMILQDRLFYRHYHLHL